MKKFVPGDSFKATFQFRNSVGDFVDPGTYYTKIEFVLYNELSTTILGKYTTETPLPSGWLEADIVDLDSDLTDDAVVLYVDSSITEDIRQGVVIAQVTRYKTNANYSSGYSKITKSGRIAQIVKVKTTS